MTEKLLNMHFSYCIHWWPWSLTFGPENLISSKTHQWLLTCHIWERSDITNDRAIELESRWEKKNTNTQKIEQKYKGLRLPPSDLNEEGTAESVKGQRAVAPADLNNSCRTRVYQSYQTFLILKLLGSACNFHLSFALSFWNIYIHFLLSHFLPFVSLFYTYQF